MHLLQIEDNKGDVALLREALKNVEMCVELSAVEDEQAALDFLGRCAPYTAVSCPDLILLDLNLPKKNGNEILQALKQHPRFKRIPIVIFTSTKEPHEVQRCYELGANAFVVKPLALEEYFAIVRTCVEFWGICQVPLLPAGT